MRPWSCRGRATPHPTLPVITHPAAAATKTRSASPVLPPPICCGSSPASHPREFPAFKGKASRTLLTQHPRSPVSCLTPRGHMSAGGFQLPRGRALHLGAGLAGKGTRPRIFSPTFSSPRPLFLSLSAPETPILILMESSRFLKAKLLSSGFPLALF